MILINLTAYSCYCYANYALAESSTSSQKLELFNSLLPFGFLGVYIPTQSSRDLLMQRE